MQNESLRANWHQPRPAPSLLPQSLELTHEELWGRHPSCPGPLPDRRKKYRNPPKLLIVRMIFGTSHNLLRDAMLRPFLWNFLDDLQKLVLKLEAPEHQRFVQQCAGSSQQFTSEPENGRTSRHAILTYFVYITATISP